MLFVLKIVTDVSPFLVRSFTYIWYHAFVGWAMMTIRCVASILIIGCPCDDGDYAEVAQSARSTTAYCLFAYTSVWIISCSTFALISLWTTRSALSLMDARFAWISVAASRSVRALHSSNTACVV